MLLPLMSKNPAPQIVTADIGATAATATATVAGMVAGIAIGIENDEIGVGTGAEEDKKMPMEMRS